MRHGLFWSWRQFGAPPMSQLCVYLLWCSAPLPPLLCTCCHAGDVLLLQPLWQSNRLHCILFFHEFSWLCLIVLWLCLGSLWSFHAAGSPRPARPSVATVSIAQKQAYRTAQVCAGLFEATRCCRSSVWALHRSKRIQQLNSVQDYVKQHGALGAVSGHCTEASVCNSSFLCRTM